MSKRRNYTTEFKHEAASLVLDQTYSTSEACEAMGVGPTAMRRWVTQLKAERHGVTPQGSRAITADQQKIQALQARVKKLEREKEILKKASALLMSDAYQFLS
jgi:transposase